MDLSPAISTRSACSARRVLFCISIHCMCLEQLLLPIFFVFATAWPRNRLSFFLSFPFLQQVLHFSVLAVYPLEQLSIGAICSFCMCVSLSILSYWWPDVDVFLWYVFTDGAWFFFVFCRAHGRVLRVSDSIFPFTMRAVISIHVFSLQVSSFVWIRLRVPLYWTDEAYLSGAEYCGQVFVLVSSWPFAVGYVYISEEVVVVSD